MNNTTVEEVRIKLRGDHVYDAYVDGTWVASRGSYLGAFLSAMDYIEEREEK